MRKFPSHGYVSNPNTYILIYHSFLRHLYVSTVGKCCVNYVCWNKHFASFFFMSVETKLCSVILLYVYEESYVLFEC